MADRHCRVTDPNSAAPDLFSHPPSPGIDGYLTWQQQRQDSANRLGQIHGLPLNRQVEIVLKGGVRLRGKLRLKEELLFVEEKPTDGIELVVDNVAFRPGEIESCLRLD